MGKRPGRPARVFKVTNPSARLLIIRFGIDVDPKQLLGAQFEIPGKVKVAAESR